ncbi:MULTISPECIES: SRPBCC family protein [Streptomyces]|uniref:Polyketide cyclase n=2 Tax=Streptomyces TaxID=1883 RepID=A0A100Y2G2_9ACTN|nr:MULTISPECIES: SRPBCC family protein [Streptomyces]KUH36460.1 polyketide cyclase [Streptomyces kanasensis]UUS32372.1 SRPBCC family protein [Streptomyces changanensis]
MRYADGPTATAESTIDAPPARVWELVTDIGLPARLSPELRYAAWLDGATAPAVGARFEGHNDHPLVGTWRTHAHVVELVEQRVFAWAVTDPDDRFGGGEPDPDRPLATWRFDLSPAPGGGTRLRLGTRLGPARSGVSLAIDRAPDREEHIVAARLAELRTGMAATLDGVRALAEDRPTAP